MNGPETEPEGSIPQGGPRPVSGRHRSDTAPITGPIHRIGRPPSGMHQEHDLDPKSWPWVVLVLVVGILAGGGAYTWGRAAGYTTATTDQVATEVFTPLPVVTITQTPKPAPRPTKTVTRAAKASPGPTIYRTAPALPAPTVTKTITARPTPRPTVTKTRTVERTVRLCFSIDLDDAQEEIPCP